MKKATKWKPTPDRKDYSTGSEDLDKVLDGGYPRGSYVVLEADVNVPLSAINLLEYSLIRNFLSQDRGVTIFPTGGCSSGEVIVHVAPYIQQDRANKLMRIYEIVKTEEERTKPYVVPLGVKANVDEDYKLWIEIQGELRKRTSQQLLKVYGFDSLESRYSEESERLFRAVSEDIINCKALGGLALAIARPNLTITSKALNMAGIHLKMVERNGSVLLYGIRPKTPLHVLERDVSKGYPAARLTAVV